MKKVYLALSVLAFVSCRFDQTGNKNVLPEDRSHGSHKSSAAHVTTGEHTAVNDSVSANSQLDASGNYIYNVGTVQDITLPDGTVIKAGDNSTENKLFTMLNDSVFTVSTDKTQGWVTLDRVYFNTSSDELTAQSRTQLNNIAALLKAYPSASVKLGGYTDNTGTQEINQPLSEGRAKSVLNDLSKAGINSGRLEAEGYGSKHPVCPANDTDVCKAQNRRVDIRITKK